MHGETVKSSQSKKNWAIYDQKFIVVFMQIARYTCPTLIKFEFSRPFFENYSNTKFHDNSYSGSRVVSCGQTDGPTDMTKVIVAFRNFANTPKMIYNSAPRL